MDIRNIDLTGSLDTHKVECFEWKDEYSLGIPEMDKDHKVLVSLLNRCINIVNADSYDENESKQEVDSILDEMMKYANYHFHREEKLMEDNRYQHLLDHQQEHQQFVIYIEITIAKYEHSELTARGLLNFLKDWLIHHILDLDKHYAPYCVGNLNIDDKK